MMASLPASRQQIRRGHLDGAAVTKSAWSSINGWSSKGSPALAHDARRDFSLAQPSAQLGHIVGLINVELGGAGASGMALARGLSA
jgi:hypothetical protein